MYIVRTYVLFQVKRGQDGHIREVLQELAAQVCTKYNKYNSYKNI
jgi:hypothetical protein